MTPTQKGEGTQESGSSRERRSTPEPRTENSKRPPRPEFFVTFVCFCSNLRPVTCTRYWPKFTESPGF